MNAPYSVVSARNLSLTFETNDGPVHALKDVNGPDKQTVAPVDGSGVAVEGGRLTAEIAPLSYRMIRLGQ